MRYVWVGVEYYTASYTVSTPYGGLIGDIVEDQSGLGLPGYARVLLHCRPRSR